jgi:hypothetical protein
MSKMISLLAAVAVMCAGCAGITPALAGKTTYSQTFEDIEPATADGAGQTTKYTLNIKAPAGVKLDDITGMAYTWDTEKGQITINKSGTTDSTAQAVAIVEAQKQIVDAILAGFTTAAQLAAPLVGQNIAGTQANEAARIQTKAAFRAQLIEALKELGVQPPPVPPLVPTPADDILGVPSTGVGNSP